MKNDFYRTETFDKKHIHFGGVIYPSDYNTDYRGKDNYGSSIAARIESDFRREKKILNTNTKMGVNTYGKH